MIQPRLAIVEDEHSLRADLSEYLASCGFETLPHASAESFYEAFKARGCDLVLLDIGLPGDSGLQVAQWVRQRCDIGIVMLTAFKESVSQVAGLQAGADAYLLKNTPMEVIAATCRSVLRRVARQADTRGDQAPEAGPPKLASDAPWRLFPERWLLVVPGAGEVLLTQTEVSLLRVLMRHAGHPVSRSELLLALGKPDTFSNSRNLENYASRLRRKIMERCSTELPLRPSYNQGYTFAALARVELA
jgi:two-component system OmpR family response regulator